MQIHDINVGNRVVRTGGVEAHSSSVFKCKFIVAVRGHIVKCVLGKKSE